MGTAADFHSEGDRLGCPAPGWSITETCANLWAMRPTRREITWPAVIVLLALPLWSSRTPAQTADEVVARYLTALGGRDRAEQVHSLRLIGTISFGPGAEGVDTVELERPMKLRTTIVMQGRTLVQAYDGHTAWTIDPFSGPPVPRVMPPAQARNVAAGADMDGPLIDYAAKGNQVTLSGMDTLNGRPEYRIAVTAADGLHDTYYIDARTFLKSHWEGQREMNGKPVVFESYFGDYRRVNGVMFPFRIDSDTKGNPGGQHLRFTSIETNVPVADARFQMPDSSATSKDTAS